MKKSLPIIIAIVIIVGGGAFYGGMLFGQSKNKNNTPAGINFQNFRNLTPEQRQQMGLPNGRSDNGQTGGNFTSGEIIAKDNTSLTLKLRDGGSKIIFYSDTTQVEKFATGTPSDLVIGDSVTINGTTNQDGSITANSIQLRPEIPNNPNNATSTNQ